MRTLRLLDLLVLLFAGASPHLFATKLAEVRVLDRDYLMVIFKDGDVTFVNDVQQVVRYGTALNTANAGLPANWSLVSSGDPNYGTARNPTGCYRKSKLNGMAQMEWTGSDFRYEHTTEHVMFLKLPFSMVQGRTYTLTINGNTNTDATTRTFTYDIFNSRSEAVHVNVVGYYPTTGIKAADLYAWLGDGGARDYTALQGRKVYVYNVATGVATEAGTVTYWKTSAGEAQGYNFTQSNVWNADFTGFTGTGTYRLAVEGVGCSDDFKIGNDVYLDPYQVSVRGFYYMRIGQNNNANLVPAARTPLYIPNVSPATTKVYLTTMQPYHPNWTTFAGGDVWDAKDEWAPYVKPGSPQNPNAWGGHSDAADWDRHLGHVSIIYDLLLPYFLSKGKLSDDNLGIAESGNGIPDLIDEARYEVDFWLRLRDGRAYSHGLNNPNANNVFYQAGPTAVAAWANAANAAMLAECFRIGGNTTLMNTYRDSAVVAYNYANGLADKMLDRTQNVGEATLRGRDFKMLAAAFLFNVTGNTTYEDAVAAESVVTTANSEIASSTLNQVWATAGYALTHRAVRYPTLQSNMRATLIAQAKSKEANYSQSRPSRRATDNDAGYFHTIQNVQHTLIAHALSADGADKSLFTNAMLLEADWGLGRNPLNFIQMGTTATPLAAERSVENLYTMGREDGITGVHPGQTPYLNTDDWACGMIMGCPGWMTSKLYPAHANWPKGEVYFNTRWVWAHSEFTPQQTMRGKMALYGYLYALGSGGSTPTPVGVTGVSVSPTSASVTVNGTQQLTATVSPANATNPAISWSSGNTAVATVGSTGLVTGVAAGTATITVTTQDGAKTATSTITVTAPASTLTIRARGNCGGETMELRVNNVTVRTWTNVSSTLADYAHTGFTGGNVKVVFTNDATTPCDRNLFVDYIRIGTVTYQTETAAVRTGCGDTQWLWCNGHFDFGTRSARLAAEGLAADDALSLHVSPNPTGTGKLHIALPGTVPAFRVDLTSLQGRRIKGGWFTGHSGELSVVEVGAGFYVLRVYVGDRVVTRKVIVRK